MWEAMLLCLYLFSFGVGMIRVFGLPTGMMPFICVFGLPRACGTLYMLIQREGVYSTTQCIIMVPVADMRMFSDYYMQLDLYFSAYCICYDPYFRQRLLLGLLEAVLVHVDQVHHLVQAV